MSEIHQQKAQPGLLIVKATLFKPLLGEQNLRSALEDPMLQYEPLAKNHQIVEVSNMESRDWNT